MRARFHAITGWLKRLLAAMDERRTFGVAAEMSFWLFCALLPLAFSIVAFVALASGPTVSFSSLFAAVPPETRALVARELQAIAEKNQTPSVVSILIAVWLGSSGIHAVFDGFEAQLGMSTKWLHKRVRALVGCGGLVAGALVVTLLWTFIGKHVSGVPMTIVGYVASAGVLYLIVAGLYLLGIPRPLRATLPRAPGTVVVIGAVVLVGVGYRTYLYAFGDGSAYQAGLSVIVVTLTAMYLFSVSLLVGLAVNQMLIPAGPKAEHVTFEEPVLEHGRP
ncbi:hypothetical protein BH09MYX1_BH09MYX1_00190 [soil metagenome]